MLNKEVRQDLMLFDFKPEDLEAFRERLELTRKDIADLFDISPVTIRNLERHKVQNPMALQMYAIVLERWYAVKLGLIPAYRKPGGDTFTHLTFVKNEAIKELQKKEMAVTWTD